jgi:cell wall-associated NlpC family hydrolase
MQIDDLIGKPFIDGGRGPGGYDCYGLVMEVFRRHGTTVPEQNISCMDTPKIAAEIEQQRPRWIRLGTPIEPAVVAIRLSPGIVNHVGVYIGLGMFVHAYRNAGGVCVDRTTDPIWRRRIEGFYVPGWLT